MGPVTGGFIAQNVGIKWVFITISSLSHSFRLESSFDFCYYAVVCGAVSIVSIPLLQETYAPVIRQRWAAKFGGDPEKACQVGEISALQENGKLHYIWLNLSRPIVLLSRSLICFVFALYMAL